MSDKKYSKCKKSPSGDLEVNEPETTYKAIPTVDKWNPNKPFHGTQEEWWEHFHKIEKGKFTPLEEANKEFEEWKEQYLKGRL